MTEAVFPLLGTAFVILVIHPLCALIAKGALLLLERRSGPFRQLNARYLVLVGSSALSLSWFLSAALHQVETGVVVACLVDHEAAALCFEPALFTATLAALTLALCQSSIRGAKGVALVKCGRASDLLKRIDQVIGRHPALHKLAKRVAVTQWPGFTLGTQGVFRPYVVVGLSYAESLSDEALVGALGHEAEHLRAFDPLRYLGLSLTLAANPFGKWLLAPHAKRWIAAREANCDREAVINGAAPLLLADAIVQAARPVRPEAVALGAHDMAMLKLRVGMLLAFAERPPARCCTPSRSVVPFAILVILITLLLPHHTSTEALDALHVGAERTFAYVWH